MFALLEALKKSRYETAVFSMQDENNLPSKQDKYFIKKVDLHKFNLINIFKFFYNYDAVKRLKILIQEEKPDIAHLHNIAHQFSPAIITILKKAGIPVVQTLHDYKLVCPNAMLFTKNKHCEKCRNGKYYNCFFNKCMKDSWLKSFMGMCEAYLWNRFLKVYDSVDVFIAPSHYMKDKCVSFGIPKEKIKIIYNFLDFKSEEGIPAFSQEKYILYYGRLSREKGIDTLLQAMEKIKPEIKLKIVGAGPDYRHLEKLIEKAGLKERVSLLGPKYADSLTEIIRNAYAIILPSVWAENMPYCLLEPMAMGKIVVAAEAGGMPEIIRNGKNGFLFPIKDDNVLASRINKLEQHDFSLIGKEAKKTILNLNSKEYMWELEGIYRSF